MYGTRVAGVVGGAPSIVLLSVWLAFPGFTTTNNSSSRIIYALCDSDIDHGCDNSPVLAAPPHVTVKQGELAGFVGQGITVFRGIPFAGDTGGANRWRSPTTAPHWDGARVGSGSRYDGSRLAGRGVALMSSPMSKGLFQRAIAQSGMALQLGRACHVRKSLPGSSSLERSGERMAKALLPDDKTVTAADLRGLSWQSIIKYQKTLRPGAWMPVIDGKVLVDAVGHRFVQGRQLPILLMIGTVSWEKSQFAHVKLPPISVMARGVPPEQVHAHYPGVKGPALVRQWLVDAQFNAPVRWVANANVKAGQTVWVCQFNHLSLAAIKAGQPGAAHADDVPYLFDVLDKPDRNLDCAAEKRMTALMGRRISYQLDRLTRMAQPRAGR